MSTMGTFSGRRFDPLMMTPEDVVLEDIAHALSLLCRGGGQLKYFYSVGQHCINCMKEAKARGWSKRMQLACLIHDASEAYISDIIRPVKVHLSNYMVWRKRRSRACHKEVRFQLYVQTSIWISWIKNWNREDSVLRGMQMMC